MWIKSGGFCGVPEGNQKLSVPMEHCIGQIVEDFRVIGVEGESGPINRDGLGISLLPDENIALTQQCIHIGAGRVELRDCRIGDIGPPVEAFIVPKICQQQLLLPRWLKVAKSAGFDQAECGLFQGFAPSEKVLFRQCPDFSVSIQQVNGFSISVPGDWYERRAGRAVSDIRGEQGQQRDVFTEHVPQEGFIGLNHHHKAVLLLRHAPDRGAADAALKRGHWHHALDLGGSEARAIRIEEGGHDGLIGAPEGIGNGGDAAQRASPFFSSSAGDGGSARCQAEQETGCKKKAPSVRWPDGAENRSGHLKMPLAFVGAVQHFIYAGSRAQNLQGPLTDHFVGNGAIQNTQSIFDRCT